MSVTLHTYLSDVTGVTIRNVSGDGHQIELLLATRKDGVVSMRLIGSKARTIRVTDMRKRDRNVHRATNLVREHAVEFTGAVRRGR